MNAAFLLFAASFITAAVVLARALPPSPARKVAAVWFGAIGVVFAPVAFLREDCWSSTVQSCWMQEQAGDLSWQHYAHLNLSAVFALFVCLSPLMLWFALSTGIVRRVCGACAVFGVVVLVALRLAVHPASPAETSGLGFFERLEALVINGWVLLVLAGSAVHVNRGGDRGGSLERN